MAPSGNADDRQGREGGESLSETKPEKTRLFRATSTSDIICASIIADLLPHGRNILALSTDKSSADLSEYRECYQSLARVYPWANVVDLSDIPIVSQFDEKRTLLNRYRGVGLSIASVRELRSRLAAALSIHAASDELKTRLNREIDELYLTVPHHPDVLALCQVLDGTRKFYYPHTLDSIGQSESDHYSRVCADRSLPWSSIIFNLLKRVLWGEDAVPLLRIKIDEAYSFRLPFPWADEQHLLGDYINTAMVHRWFAALPDRVQGYYRALAAECGEAIGVLLLTVDDSPQYVRKELDAVVYLAQELSRRCPGRSILVKTHPRSGTEHMARVLGVLSAALPEIRFVPITRYYFYPIEIVLAPFHAVGCAGLGTTSLRTLHSIYRIDAYCPIDLLRSIYNDDPKTRTMYDRWIEEYSPSLIGV